MKENKSSLPIGKPKELNIERETLPTLEVRNKVIWINPNLDIPFNLKLGEQTKLARFLTSAPSENEVINVETEFKHNRSGILGRIFIASKDRKDILRDMDIKGLGHAGAQFDLDSTYADSGTKPLVVYEVERRWVDDNSFGITNQEDALRDAEMAEKMNMMGIRVHRAIVVSKIEEIVDINGKKISIDQARSRNMLTPEIEPVVEVRGFGTRTRLSDIRPRHNPYNHSRNHESRMLIDAMHMVAQELGKNPEKFSLKEYTVWLVKITARNVGLMHKNNLVHGYLDAGHNITLDGRIVDLDSIKTLNAKNEDDQYLMQSDKRDAKTALNDFIQDLISYYGLEPIIFDDLFESEYNAAKGNSLLYKHV